MKFRGPQNWNEFTKAVHLRFGPTDYEDPSEALTRLRHTSTVAAYQEAFEKLSHQVDGLSEGFIIGCFIVGLRDDVRLDVKIKQPKTLADAIGIARLVEERNQLQKKPPDPSCSQPIIAASKTNSISAPGVLGPPPVQRGNSNANANPTSFRRLTNQEARECREKGLCYYCDEKFTPGHRCQRPQLFMIEYVTHSSVDEDEQGKAEPNYHEVMPEFSFHAISGASHPQTIHVLGKLRNKNVIVLMDGAQHP